MQLELRAGCKPRWAVPPQQLCLEVAVQALRLWVAVQLQLPRWAVPWGELLPWGDPSQWVELLPWGVALQQYLVHVEAVLAELACTQAALAAMQPPRGEQPREFLCL